MRIRLLASGYSPQRERCSFVGELVGLMVLWYLEGIYFDPISGDKVDGPLYVNKYRHQHSTSSAKDAIVAN